MKADAVYVDIHAGNVLFYALLELFPIVAICKKDLICDHLKYKVDVYSRKGK